jgi:hypothetical protein
MAASRLPHQGSSCLTAAPPAGLWVTQLLPVASSPGHPAAIMLLHTVQCNLHVLLLLLLLLLPMRVQQRSHKPCSSNMPV